MRTDEFFFKVRLLLFAEPQRLFIFLFLREIADDTEHHGAVRGIHRAEHDINREFGSIFAPAVELEARAHGTHAGISVAGAALFWISSVKSLRNEESNRWSRYFR